MAIALDIRTNLSTLALVNPYPGKYTSLDEAVAFEIKAQLKDTRGVSITGIAEALHIRRATLSARVNGHAPFSPSLLADVAAQLGTTASEVMAAAERRRNTARAGHTVPGSDHSAVAS